MERSPLEWLRRLRGCGVSPFDVPNPGQDAPILVQRNALSINQFFLEDIEILVIQIEAQLEGAIGHTSLAFEERDDLLEDFIECHGLLPTQLCSPFVHFLDESRLTLSMRKSMSASVALRQRLQ